MGLNPVWILVGLLLVFATVWIGLRVLLIAAQSAWLPPEAALAREFQEELRERGLLSSLPSGLAARGSLADKGD